MTSELYPGVGKAEVEIQRISLAALEPRAASFPAPPGRRGIVYILMRNEIESRDLRRLVCGFGRHVSIRRVRHLHGRTSFTVSGYENDARELCEIPEVRAYFSEAFRRCPVLLPAADLRNECLRAAVFCALQNLTVVHRIDTDRRLVHVEPCELERFFTSRLPAQAALHKTLGWARERGVAELKRLRRYLGLPKS